MSVDDILAVFTSTWFEWKGECLDEVVVQTAKLLRSCALTLKQSCLAGLVNARYGSVHSTALATFRKAEAEVPTKVHSV